MTSTHPCGANGQPNGHAKAATDALEGADARLPRRIRVFTMDDDPLVRRGLYAVVDRQPDMRMCGEATGVSAAKKAITELKPDLVIVDLVPDEGDGFELLAWLRPSHPRVRSVVFSSLDGFHHAERAFMCGAQEFVVKADGLQRLLRAIRHVMQGHPYIRDSSARAGGP